MKTRTARQVFGTGILLSCLALVACGGGGGGDTSAGSPLGGGAFLPALPAQDQATTAIALAPSGLIIGNCNTNIPFIFSGGVPPYSVTTSDNFRVPVSSPLALNDDRFYFFADVRYVPTWDKGLFGTASITVLDSQSRSAIATVTTPLPTDQCPANPILKLAPQSADLRTDEILAFQMTGGATSLTPPTVTFADEGVAQVVAMGAGSFTVRAVARAGATTLMTIAGTDGQRASAVLNVLPGR